MFLVDDVLSKALDYFFKRVEAGRSQHDSAIKNIRVAMRALSSSLSEITLQLEAGLHRLRRKESDREAYFSELEKLVDSGFLNSSCNESGICKELRIAQDELFDIVPANSSEDLSYVRSLASQLEAYESAFVSAILEFLAGARGVDLTAATATDKLIETTQVTAALAERLGALTKIRADIDVLLAKLRESSYSQ
jgi:hypothetical protein